MSKQGKRITRKQREREKWLQRKRERENNQQIPIERSSAARKPLIRGELERAVPSYGRYRSRITEISREATAGGVIYRVKDGELQILLVEDHFNRWTIPKGHIEPGETARETAIREIGEEAGVHELESICWLGKIHFRYRRENILVLMSTQIYLFKALGDTDDIKKEDWMNGIRWFSYNQAVSLIAYKDIVRLTRLARRRLIERGEISDEE